MKLSKEFIVFLILTAVVLTAAVCFLFFPAAEHIVFYKIPENKSVQILFVGDSMFDRGIRYYANKNGGNDFIFEKINQKLKGYDLVVANLEGPITDEKSISAGTTPGTPGNYFFTFDPSWAKTLFENNIKIVNLGNNHILNFGSKGLASTKKYLDEAGVGYFGGPGDPKNTSKEINDIKITFINYNEFSSLDVELEQKSTVEDIKKAKEFSDIVIVFCHWGAEYVGPDQVMANLAHQFIDTGADLVIGSHSHVIGPSETYNGKKIYYSLGNFIFDQYFNEDVRGGLGVAVKINKETRKLDYEELNFYLQSNGQTVEKTE